MRVIAGFFIFSSLLHPLVSFSQGMKDYQNFRGNWQGKVEFTVNTGPNPKAEAGVSLKISPDGALTGATDSGCKLTGTARQVSAAAPTNGTLTVTAAECKDSRYNLEYSGFLAVSPTEKSAHMNLTPAASSVPGRPTLDGTFTRAGQ